MRGFIKTFIVFIYLFLALFIQSSSIYAEEYIPKNDSKQYIVSPANSETALINNKNEENYVISQNRNKSEITNPSGRNDNLGFGCFNKTNVDYSFSNSYIGDSNIYKIYISHKLSPLEYTIYTRAP